MADDQELGALDRAVVVAAEQLGHQLGTLAHLPLRISLWGARQVSFVPGMKGVALELGLLQQRFSTPSLERQGPDPAVAVRPEVNGVAHASGNGHTRPGASPQSLLTSLLDESAKLDAPGAEALHASLVEALLPDEARLLAALSTGEAHVALEVTERISRRSAPMILLRTSTAGRSAGCRQPDLVPWYLARLSGSGLVSYAGPLAGDEAKGQYDRLLVETYVSRTIEEAEARGARVRTRPLSLRMSGLGQSFWADMTAEG